MANPGSLKPFKKGHDPRRNVKGRINGSESSHFNALLMKYLNKVVDVGGTKKTMMELLAERVVHDAVVTGKIGAIKILYDRVEGKAPTASQVDRRTNSGGYDPREDEDLKRLVNMLEDDEVKKKRKSQESTKP